jgi:hypothetical protein
LSATAGEARLAKRVAESYTSPQIVTRGIRRLLACVLICAATAPALARLTATGLTVIDRNHDGRPDVWQFQNEAGDVTLVTFDNNFDGIPDLADFYEHGALVRREIDRNLDGTIDRVDHFNSLTGERTRSVTDADFDGTADLLVFFQKGEPVSSTARGEPSLGAAPAERARSPGSAPAAGHWRLVRMVDPFGEAPALDAGPGAPPEHGTVALGSFAGLPSAPAVMLKTGRRFFRPQHAAEIPASAEKSGPTTRGPPPFLS